MAMKPIKGVGSLPLQHGVMVVQYCKEMDKAIYMTVS